jgi:hypothetical protein
MSWTVTKPTRLATRWLREFLPLDGKSSIGGIWDALGMFASASELFLGLTQHQESCTTS